VLRYIELKSGSHDNGPAWIARVATSRSGGTVYFDGMALKRAGGGATGNHIDLVSRDEYWVSGVKKRGTNRHWAGSGPILVEAAAVPELLALLGQPALDPARFVVTHAIEPTNPADFVHLENAVSPQ
jgi:hypothetical protein